MKAYKESGSMASPTLILGIRCSLVLSRTLRLLFLWVKMPPVPMWAPAPVWGVVEKRKIF